MKRRVSILIYSLILVVMQTPWLLVGGKNQTIYQVYMSAVSDGLMAFPGEFQEQWNVLYAKADPELMLSAILSLEMGLMMLYQILCLCYLIALIKGKNSRIKYGAMTVSLAVAILNCFMTGFSYISENGLGVLLPVIVALLGGVEFMMGRMLEEWEETVKAESLRKQRDREFKEESRRRLEFPGKYHSLFYRVVFKNFKSNWKDYLMFIICGVTAICILTVEFGMQEMLAGIHSEESFLVSQGIGRIVTNSMIPILAICVSLIVFVLVFYLKTRVKSYGMFLMLGARANVLIRMAMMEFLGSFLISLLFGVFLGNRCIYVLKQLTGMQLEMPGIGTYLKMLFAVSIIYLASFMITRDIYIDFNISRAAVRKILKEKMPVRFLGKLCIAGCVLSLGSLVLYSRLSNYEYVVLLMIFFAGLFLLLRYGSTVYLQKEKEKTSYIQRVLPWNQFYYKSRTSVWYLTVLTVIHVCVLFYFSFQIISVTIAEEPEELFPYDFVCIADENDEEFFKELSGDYEIEISKYPMVRVTNLDMTEKKESLRDGRAPMGQQIGISESTYHQLKAAIDPEYQATALKLNGNTEIYAVHQQDKSIKAQPIDWFGPNRGAFLHIGQPPVTYALQTLELSFPLRKIEGEEIGSLIGTWGYGITENLVVFSDEYFEEAVDAWSYTSILDGKYIENEAERIKDVTIHQGPTRLVLIKAKEEDLDGLEMELSGFRKRHAYDEQFNLHVLSCYSKRKAISDMTTERIMKLTVNALIIGAMILAGTILLGVKTISELDERKNRSVFLESLGMPEKERIGLIQSEMWVYYRIPIALAVGISICFTAATFMARMYEAADILSYIRNARILWAGYLLLEWCILWGLTQITIRKVERRYEEHN